MPPPTGSAMPIPRRSSTFPLPARPCHLMAHLRRRYGLQCSSTVSVRTCTPDLPKSALPTRNRSVMMRMRWILQLNDKVAIVTGSSRGLGLGQRARAGRRRLPRHAVRPDRGAASRGRGRGRPQTAGAADRVLAVAGGRQHRGRRGAASSTRTVETFGGVDVARQQRRRWPAAGAARDLGRGMAGGDRSDADAGGSRLAAGRAAHAAPRRRVDHHHRVDLRPRGGRPHDVQRGQGGADQPGQVAGAAARLVEHPRQQRVAGVDPVRGRIVVEAAAGGSRRASPSSSSASCRSAASAGPRKSPTSSRSSRHRERAGSAERRSSSTAVRAGRSRRL